MNPENKWENFRYKVVPKLDFSFTGVSDHDPAKLMKSYFTLLCTSKGRNKPENRIQDEEPPEMLIYFARRGQDSISDSRLAINLSGIRDQLSQTQPER